MSEAAAPEFKPGDRVQFTSPRGAVEDGVVVKDLYPGAVEVKFDSGETRGVYANSLKPLPAAVAESIDPVEQLRADILRFAR
jgi:anaerobic selenocysteine-containing dehydrogenase